MKDFNGDFLDKGDCVLYFSIDYGLKIGTISDIDVNDNSLCIIGKESVISNQTMLLPDYYLDFFDKDINSLKNNYDLRNVEIEIDDLVVCCMNNSFFITSVIDIYESGVLVLDNFQSCIFANNVLVLPYDYEK